MWLCKQFKNHIRTKTCYLVHLNNTGIEQLESYYKTKHFGNHVLIRLKKIKTSYTQNLEKSLTRLHGNTGTVNSF